MPPSGAAPIALSHLLYHTAEVVLAVQSGRSLTEVLATEPAALRPGVQALAFETLRRLGGWVTLHCLCPSVRR